MDNKIIELLSEEIRQTKNLVLETRRMADAAEKKTDAAWEQVKEVKRHADATWELVVITRNEADTRLKRLERPFWKKLLGIKED